MFGSGMGVDGTEVGSGVVKEGDKNKKEEAKHCRKRGPSASRAEKVAFEEESVGSVKGQQKEQCTNKRGQKGWHEQMKL